MLPVPVLAFLKRASIVCEAVWVSWLKGRCVWTGLWRLDSARPTEPLQGKAGEAWEQVGVLAPIL